MRRVVPLAALTVCFVLNACGVDDPEVRLPNSVKRAIAAESVPPKRNAVLELGLSAVGKQSQDRIVVRTSVSGLVWRRASRPSLLLGFDSIEAADRELEETSVAKAGATR
jgi:hypothetical protein